MDEESGADSDVFDRRSGGLNEIETASTHMTQNGDGPGGGGNGEQPQI